MRRTINMTPSEDPSTARNNARRSATRPVAGQAAHEGSETLHVFDAEEPPADRPLASAMDLLVRHLTEGDTGISPHGRPWQEVFLEAMSKAPIVAVAARIAGVSRRQVREAQESDPEFASRWDDAMEDGVDAVEAAAFKSAVFGDERSTGRAGKGEAPGVEYSHPTRIFYLKARRPEVFGDKKENEGARELVTLPELQKRMEEAKA